MLEGRFIVTFLFLCEHVDEEQDVKKKQKKNEKKEKKNVDGQNTESVCSHQALRQILYK